MANTVAASDSRPVSFATPALGDRIKASDISHLPSVLNAGLSEIGAGCVISQEWPDGQASHAGDIPTDEMEDVPLASWIIPIPSDRHAALRINIRAWRSAGVPDGRVIIRSRNAVDEVSVDVGAGVASADDWTELDLLTIAGADSAAGDAIDMTEVIDLFLESDDPGTTVTLVQIAAEIAVLAHPGDNLIAASVTTNGLVANPLGVASTIVEDGPLSTPIGFALIEADAALRLRPALACCWSGLDPVYDGAAAEDRWLPDHGVVTAFRESWCDDRRRYGRFASEGGGVEQALDLMPSDRGSVQLVTNAVPDTFFTAIGGGDAGQRRLVVSDIQASEDGPSDDVLIRAGAVLSLAHRRGLPNVGVAADAPQILLQGYSAWVRDPVSDGGLPNPLDPTQVLFAQAVSGETIGRLGKQLVWHLTRRSAGMVHHVIDYDRSSGPIELQRPAPLTPTYRLLWTLSPGTRFVLVWLRYQAADLSETTPEFSIALASDTGDPIDAGYTVTPDEGLAFDPGTGGDDVWPLRGWMTPHRVPAGGSPRPLEIADEDAGSRVELTLSCTNMRVVSISAIELPADLPPLES